MKLYYLEVFRDYIIYFAIILSIIFIFKIIFIREKSISREYFSNMILVISIIISQIIAVFIQFAFIIFTIENCILNDKDSSIGYNIFIEIRLNESNLLYKYMIFIAIFIIVVFVWMFLFRKKLIALQKNIDSKL